MSRHEKDLEDMHDLLQQMRDMHAMEYDVPDNLEGFGIMNTIRSAKKFYGTTFGKNTIEKIEKWFKETYSEADAQKPPLNAYMISTKNNKDVFSVLSGMISIDVVMNILENKSVDEKRSDSDLYGKQKKDPRVQTALEHFENFRPEQQKIELQSILTQVYTKKTPIEVLHGLLEVSTLQSEIKKTWKVE
jgi:hypothetical protein